MNIWHNSSALSEELKKVKEYGINSYTLGIHIRSEMSTAFLETWSMLVSVRASRLIVAWHQTCFKDYI